MCRIWQNPYPLKKSPKNDYNLAVSSYVEQKDTREVINIDELNAQIRETVTNIDRLRAEIDKIVAEIEGKTP